MTTVENEIAMMEKFDTDAHDFDEDEKQPAAETETETERDPYLWLEDVEGERAIDWVKSFNAISTKELQAQPQYEEIHQDIRNILFAKDRVPFAQFEEQFFWNFWEDAQYKHGILRRCRLEEYVKETPQWEILLDLDQLSEKEQENWVYSSRARFDRHSERGYVALSRGGKDAVVIREFNFETGEFVEPSQGGFFIPEAKSDVTPIDDNYLLVGSDFGEKSLTTSGYPRQIKLWKRNESLTENAKLVFEVQESDVTASAAVLDDGPNEKHILFYRIVDFFNKEIFYQQTISKEEGDQTSINHEIPLRQLPLPTTSSLLGIKGHQIYIQLKEPLTVGERNFANNSIIRIPLCADSLLDAEVVFVTEKGQSIEEVVVWKDRLFVTLLENVRSRVIDLQLSTVSNEWTVKELPFPNTGMITLSMRDEDDAMDFTTVMYTDHLTPNSQYLVHREGSEEVFRMQLLKNAPHRFDASQFEVLQHFATSKDGTRVPYFILQRKGLQATGDHPTILYGYGGFEISLTPYYSSVIGKVWLERGGVYVISNIRGGGEFGPEWHQAALKTKRQCAYDDFYAVAEDLIARKITSSRHLGINGGSNGGLLVGVSMTQRPELFNAVLIQVPLLDMLRFHLLLAGASWTGEYGSPENTEEKVFLESISPYHNVKANVKYPKPLLTTSTKDDRVHPGHARKMVARLAEQGHELLYYENINGGHAGSANLEEYAFMNALGYTYMWQQLSK